LFENIF